jgi:hypothetical protein
VVNVVDFFQRAPELHDDVFRRQQHPRRGPLLIKQAVESGTDWEKDGAESTFGRIKRERGGTWEDVVAGI